MFSRRSLQWIVALVLLVAGNYVQSNDEQESSHENVVALGVTETKYSGGLRSLWKTWKTQTTTTTSSSSSPPPAMVVATPSTTTTTTTTTNSNNNQELPCQLCHDSSYPKNPNHGVVVSFHSFSFTGTCGNLYYELQNRPVWKSNAICNPLQDRFDWSCGCNPNYTAEPPKPNTVDLGTGYGQWGW